MCLSGNAQIAMACRSFAACPALEMMTVFAVLKFGVPWDPLEFAGFQSCPTLSTGLSIDLCENWRNYSRKREGVLLHTVLI